MSDNIPDMDEMIEDCKKKQRPDEEICFGFGVGRMIPLPTDSRPLRRAIKQAQKYISALEGFIGVYPIELGRNVLIFDSLNNAKGGRNLLKNKDCHVGQIVPILVNKQFIRRTS